MNQEQLIKQYCMQESVSYRAQKKILLGLILIVMGILFILVRTGSIEAQSISHYWPLLLTLLGVQQLIFSQHIQRKWNGVFRIILSLWLFACLEHVWGWTFSVTWPMILIAFGLCKIGCALTAKKTNPFESPL